MSQAHVSERLSVLADEVLEHLEHADGDGPGREIFEAIVRLLALGEGESTPGVDLALREAIARRMAWGDGEDLILTDAETVFDRLSIACARTFVDRGERALVSEAAAAVVAAVARMVALAALERAGLARAGRLREEITQRQLRRALDDQRTSLDRLERS